MKSRVLELKRDRDGYDAKINEKDRQLKSLESELKSIKKDHPNLVPKRKDSDQVLRRHQRFR